MTDCIKTGARVYVSDYDAWAPADLYEITDETGDVCAVVVRFPGDFYSCCTWEDLAGSQSTHVLHLGHDTCNWWRKDLGIAVIPPSQLKKV